jgi:hypothetical protein
VSVASINVLRLEQVRRRIGIQPYERSYLGLVLPAAAAALAALGAHAALSDRPWWSSLAATGACGLAAYAGLLPLALPAHERAALFAPLGRMANRLRTVSFWKTLRR